MTAETQYLEAEARARTTRARLISSANALKHRVSPPVIVHELRESAKGKAVEALDSARGKAVEAMGEARDKGTELAVAASGVARRNPVAVGTAAGMVGLLLMRRPIAAIARRIRGKPRND